MQRMRMMPVLLSSHRTHLVWASGHDTVANEQLLYDAGSHSYLHT